MTQTQKYLNNSPLTDLRNSFEDFISTYSRKYADVLDALSRQVVPFGGNLLENSHRSNGNITSFDKPNGEDKEYFENRYSVLYTLNGQYQHIGCSSQAEAQSVQGIMMTDGNRIPVGIYDAATDSFEWEMIGQYFHSQDSLTEQHNRLEEVLTVARVLRRRDSSWQPGYLQKPGFFA